jgi:CDGSH-type Zn-finger protein
MSDEPLCAQKGPYQVTLEAGKPYFWCTCGRSAKQPFCDGSHKATTLQPHRFVADKLRHLQPLRLQEHRRQALLRRHA